MKIMSLAAILLCLGAGWSQAEPIPAVGPVSSVIVYRG